MPMAKASALIDTRVICSDDAEAEAARVFKADQRIIKLITVQRM